MTVRVSNAPSSSGGQHNLLLDVRELYITAKSRHGQFEILSGVTIAIRPGEIVGVLGESGSGKSTLARTIIGLNPDTFTPISKRMTFEHTDLAGLDDEQFRALRGRQIGMIFQDPASFLDPMVRVGGQIEEAIRLHVPRAQRSPNMVEDFLRRAGITDTARVADAYPFQLSGGLQQRAMIAVALSCRPTLLLADEPTSSLDVVVQREILALLRDIADQGVAVLLVTHDIAIVSEICDTVYVLYAGRVAEYGPADQVVAEPVHPYTRALLASNIMDGADPVPIPGHVPRVSDPPTGCRFHPRCGFALDRCKVEQPPMDEKNARGSACWVMPTPS